jgi:hypothetical protein
MEGSFSSLRTAGISLRSTNSAWCLPGRDVLAAPFAADREVAVPSLLKVENERQHRRTKGEYPILISSELSPGLSVRCVESDVISLVSVVYGEAY